MVCLKSKIALNVGRRRWKLKVANTGDRPIQVGSHYPFLEVNKHLAFDRHLAHQHALRLDIAAGTAVRFEPGDRKTVTLVEAGGSKRISGGSGITRRVTENGERLADILREGGFQVEAIDEAVEVPEPKEMDREVVSIFQLLRDHTTDPATSRQYASMFGPTTGDRVRLGDTSLWVEIESDATTYGDECKFGGGKTVRDGQGQASDRCDQDVLDLVITNALVIDWSGIFKADIGVKRGIIVGVGKAGNPDIMDGVTDGMVIGSNTEVIAGEKLILTAGAIDAHVHYICTDLWKEAIASGITTLIGGGTGPSAGTNATTCTPSKFYMQAMLQATDSIPLNFGFTGKGNDSGRSMAAIKDVVEAGACGLKLHEDWGSTPECIDRALTVGDEYDVQVNIHTDTLNESGFVESTIDAFKGRTIHTCARSGADWRRELTLTQSIPADITQRERVADTRRTSLSSASIRMYCRVQRTRLGHTQRTRSMST